MILQGKAFNSLGKQVATSQWPVAADPSASLGEWLEAFFLAESAVTRVEVTVISRVPSSINAVV